MGKTLEQMTDKTRSYFTDEAVKEYIKSQGLDLKTVEQWVKKEDDDFEIFNHMLQFFAKNLSEYTTYEDLLDASSTFGEYAFCLSNEDRIRELGMDEIIRSLKEDINLCVYGVLQEHGYTNEIALNAMVAEKKADAHELPPELEWLERMFAEEGI